MQNAKLIFRLNVEVYHQLCSYRQQMDYQIICDQFERSGRAKIVSLKGKPSFGQIIEKLEIGADLGFFV